MLYNHLSDTVKQQLLKILLVSSKSDFLVAFGKFLKDCAHPMIHL